MPSCRWIGRPIWCSMDPRGAGGELLRLRGCWLRKLSAELSLEDPRRGAGPPARTAGVVTAEGVGAVDIGADPPGGGGPPGPRAREALVGGIAECALRRSPSRPPSVRRDGPGRPSARRRVYPAPTAWRSAGVVEASAPRPTRGAHIGGHCRSAGTGAHWNGCPAQQGYRWGKSGPVWREAKQTMVMNGDLRQVGVLGGLGVRPAHRLPGVGRRVLAYLAVHHSVADRTLMCGRLWPDLTESRARANLRRALWQLPPGWVVPMGTDLALDAEVDLDRARQAAELALTATLLSVGRGRPASCATCSPAGTTSDARCGSRSQPSASAGSRRSRTRSAGRRRRRATTPSPHGSAGSRPVCAEPLRESAVAALVEARLGAGQPVRGGSPLPAVRRSCFRSELDAEPGARL